MKKTKKHPKQGAYAMGMPAAAAILGATLAAVKAAKDGGCPAFKPSGKIHLEQLRQWLKDHPAEIAKAETKEQAQTRFEIARANRMEIENAKRLRELIPVAMAKQIYGRLINEAKLNLYGSIARFTQLARMAESTAVANGEIKAEIDATFAALKEGKW